MSPHNCGSDHLYPTKKQTCAETRAVTFTARLLRICESLCEQVYSADGWIEIVMAILT